MKIPEKLKAKFTKWYFKRGYKFGYNKNREAYWICPWYIRPLLILFSPSVYCLTEIQSAVDKINVSFKSISNVLNDLVDQINKSLDEYAKKVKEREVEDNDQIND